MSLSYYDSFLNTLCLRSVATSLSIDSATKKYLVPICTKTFCQIGRQTDDLSAVNETCLDLWDTVTGHGSEESNSKDESDARNCKNPTNGSGYTTISQRRGYTRRLKNPDRS